jgi:thiamine-phosphate pyrophosphorylase
VSGAARPALRGLYAITPGIADTRTLLARVEACLAGGAAALQYRAKALAPQLALEQAQALAAACRRRGALFIVNDSVELARATAADGVHLGRDDGDPAAARRALPRAIIGISCYADPERARAAAAAGADYVAIGSVFASATKPAAVRAPLHALAQARRIAQRPVVAIGGITLDNAGLALDAGADMVAVISALFDAPDVTAAARAFTELFDAQTTGARDVRS